MILFLDCVLSRIIFLKACYLYAEQQLCLLRLGVYEVSLVSDDLEKPQRASHAYSRGAMSTPGGLCPLLRCRVYFQGSPKVSNINF